MTLSVLILLGLSLAVTTTTLEAQRYRFKEYRQEHGLGNLAVTALIQDLDGYLWVGTQNGLFRHDGNDFVRFGAQEGLPGSYILALALAPDGQLWANTHQGIARLDKGRFRAEFPYRQSADTPGMGMAINAKGDIFVSSPQGIILGRKAAAGSAYRFALSPIPAKYRSKTIFQIALDPAGRAWFGCGNELCGLSAEGALEIHGEDWAIPADHWDGIHFDARQSLWLRSNQQVLVKHARSPRFEPALHAPVAFDMPHIYSGAGGRVYLPSKDGLHILEPARNIWRKLGPENGLAGEMVSVVFSDAENNVWLGFLGDGLSRWLSHDNWEGWTTQEGLNSNTVWTMLRDGARALWAGTDNGINFMEAGAKRWKALGGESGKDLGRVMALTAESASVVWAASHSRGLIRIDTAARAFQVLGFPPGSGIKHLYGLLMDREARLWLGTTSGLFQTTPTHPLDWQPQDLKDSEHQETIYTVTQDSRGRIWAAGNLGLMLFQHGQWSRLEKKHGLLSNSTWFARETFPGEIVVGYLDSVGETSIRFQNQQTVVTHSSVGSGGPVHLNYFAGLDKGGLSWLGTDQGVFVSDRRDTLHLTDQDGLIWNDCNSNAFFADDDGTVWIGTTRGLAHGRMPNPLPLTSPKLKAVSLTVNGQPVPAEGTVHIGSIPNELELIVSPLTFQNAGRIEYQFRLGQPEEPWITVRRNFVKFSGIPGGSSRLQARLRISGGAWSQIWIDLPVEVAVPFWQSWMGRGLMLLAVIGSMALLWQFWHQKLIADRERLAAAVAARTNEIERLLKEAREASRLKTEFVANMSHEIRTPMNGVLGMLQLTASTNLNAEQRGFVEVAKSSAETLLALLNEILDLSKVESGFLEVECYPFKLRQLIQDLALLLEPNAIKKGIRLEIEIDPKLSAWVLGDKQRLQQVLLNLTGNAIKFTHQGCVKLRVSQTGRDQIEFSVEDTGIGIPPGKQSLIFDAFRQADGSTTRRFGGTGLGLAISSKLVSLMGGEIRVESEVGLGSRFFFSIALPSAQPSDVTQDWNQSDPASRPLSILLAEDNRVNQMVAMRLLERDGHTVQVALDGALAFEAVHRERFDLILMDIHMPVLDGISATEKIREYELTQGRRTPIVALSAGVLPEERNRCIAAGMDAFLAKPIDIVELRQTLARLTVLKPPASSRS